MTRTARTLAGLAAVGYVNAVVFMVATVGSDAKLAVVICTLLAVASVAAATRARYFALVALPASIVAFIAFGSFGPLVAPSAVLLWFAAIVTARAGFPRTIVAIALVTLFILGANDFPNDDPWTRFQFGCVAAASYMPLLWVVGLGAAWAKRRRGLAEAQRAADADAQATDETGHP